VTLDSSAIVWIALVVGVLIAVALLLRWRGTGQQPTIDHQRIMEQTRRVAEEAARTAAQEAQEAAVRAYEEQQRLQRVEEAAKRHEAGLRAKETKKKRIAGLREWREPFVQFVRRPGRAVLHSIFRLSSTAGGMGGKRADAWESTWIFFARVWSSLGHWLLQ